MEAFSFASPLVSKRLVMAWPPAVLASKEAGFAGTEPAGAEPAAEAVGLGGAVEEVPFVAVASEVAAAAQAAPAAAVEVVLDKTRLHNPRDYIYVVAIHTGFPGRKDRLAVSAAGADHTLRSLRSHLDVVLDLTLLPRPLQRLWSWTTSCLGREDVVQLVGCHTSPSPLPLPLANLTSKLR